MCVYTVWILNYTVSIAHSYIELNRLFQDYEQMRLLPSNFRAGNLEEDIYKKKCLNPDKKYFAWEAV